MPAESRRPFPDVHRRPGCDTSAESLTQEGRFGGEGMRSCVVGARKGVPNGHAAIVVPPPVVLVPGRLPDRLSWFVLERHLRRIGFAHVSSVHRHPFDTVSDVARGLARKVAVVRAVTGSARVHLVGHGTGGIAVRHYLQRLGGHRVVETAVILGSLHEGTSAALLDWHSGTGRLRSRAAIVRWREQRTAAGPVRRVAYLKTGVLLPPANAESRYHPGVIHIVVEDEGQLRSRIPAPLARSVAAYLAGSAPTRSVGASSQRMEGGAAVRLVERATPQGSSEDGQRGAGGVDR